LQLGDIVKKIQILLSVDLENLIKDCYGDDEKIFPHGSIKNYVAKIRLFSTLITYYRESTLVGFISFYCNDRQSNVAFLTMLIIDKEYRGSGLATLLITTSINDLNSKGFKSYRLEVAKDNFSAISLYKKLGFEILTFEGNSYIMELVIENNG